MTHWTTRPICAFDLETTGRDPLSARIVTGSVVTVGGEGHRTRNWIVDPGVEIPVDAAAVHGISTAQARERGQDYASGYREIRSALTDAWAAGHVVVAFNAAYDLTVLDAEGRRLGWPPLSGYGLVVDPTSSIGRWIVTGAASAHLAHCASTTGWCWRLRTRPSRTPWPRRSWPGSCPGGSPTSRPSTTS